MAPADLRALLAAASKEEGPSDITSVALIPVNRKGRAVIRSRQTGVLAGAALLQPIAHALAPDVRVIVKMTDGRPLRPGSLIAELTGPLRSLLRLERIALNFLTHLCGIATLTAAYVKAVRGTRARILDTRKTLPGLRALEKYAVRCGGGENHRMGLADAVLVKDNHIAHLRPGALTPTLTAAIHRLRRLKPRPAFVEVEVDNLSQLRAVLTCPVDIVLLDNMTARVMRKAVSLRDQIAPAVLLEASGGVNLQTVGTIARTGVDRISVGAVTHSAPALDLGMDIL